MQNYCNIVKNKLNMLIHIRIKTTAGIAQKFNIPADKETDFTADSFKLFLTDDVCVLILIYYTPLVKIIIVVGLIVYHSSHIGRIADDAQDIS